jgi:phage-related protein
MVSTNCESGSRQTDIAYCTFFGRDIVVVTHGFQKKSDEIPATELSKAVQMKKKFEASPASHSMMETIDE